MKSAANVRNFAVAGHTGSGKTSLCDLMLFKAGANNRLGKVSERTSVSDYTPDEQDKLSSIYATALNARWKDHHFFFMDTPGYGEFIAEPIAAIANADMTLIVVDAVEGLAVGCSRAAKIAKTHDVPRAFFINGMDKELADFEKALSQLQDAYGKNICVPVTLPVGKGAALSKVVDVLKDASLPPEVASEAEACKGKIMDCVAESDEALMTRYLDGQKLTEEEISSGLRKAVQAGTLVPVFVGCVEKDLGVEELLNGIISIFPDPLARGKIADKKGGEVPLSADGTAIARVFKSVVDPFIGQLTYFRVYSGTFTSDSEVYDVSKGAKERFGSILTINGKTQTQVEAAVPGMFAAVAKLKEVKVNDTLDSAHGAVELPAVIFPAPVMSVAISAVKSGEEEKIIQGLNKMCVSDPTLRVARHPETHQMLLQGMGDQHINLAIKKLKEAHKLETHTESPRIPYRETITSHGEGHHRHKKQTGGHGQFAEVYLKVDPNEAGYEFENGVVGGSIPRNFIPAVEKGVVEAMVNGPLAGCHVERMKVTVYDGKHHEVDSSEMAFKIAARSAFRDAMEKAKPIILEPIMKVKIMIPDQYMGDISGDLSLKRGRILGMGVEEGLQVVIAEAPIAEMQRYATELRSMTQGKGSFEMEFSRYEMVPSNVAKQIIEAHKKEVTEE